jgi:Paraquat-inducible protein A
LALGDKRSASYSLLSLGFAIPSSVDDPWNAGIRFLQLAYYFYAVVTPLVCVILLTILQIKPLTVTVQHSLLVMAEIANAWSAVEVFVLSIVAALLQISTFTAFIVGDRCDQVNALLREYFGGEISPGDAVCYKVEASVASDCWFLMVGVLLNSFIVSVVLRFARCAMDERMTRAGILEQLSYPAVSASPNAATTPPPDAAMVRSTIAKAMFQLPLSSVLFGEALYYSVGVLPNDQDRESEEEVEEQPEWRYWF